MIKAGLVLTVVLAIALMELPGLLGPGQRRPLVAVSVLLLLSLISGLMVVSMPEGPTVAKTLELWLLPLGEALLGPS